MRITHDRRTKKDAFYFYQANWSDRPMLHIASRRLTPRRLATTEVKIYSNCTAVQLRVNGNPLGAAQPDDVHVFRWNDVTLQPGENVIEAVARTGAGDQVVTDSCPWVLRHTEAGAMP